MAEFSEPEVWQTRQMGIVALAATAIIFDGLDKQVLGFAMPSLIAEWGVTKAEMSPVSAAGLTPMARTIRHRFSRNEPGAAAREEAQVCKLPATFSCPTTAAISL